MGYGNKLRVISSPGGIIGNLIFEEIDQGGIPHYAIQKTRKAEGSPEAQIKIQPNLELSEGFMYTPINPPFWILPPPPEPYGAPQELFDKINVFIHNHIDFETEDQYLVYVSWIMANWLVERWDSLPYLWFHGPSNSGKTRCQDILAFLCYRPLLSPSVSAASLYRALDAYHPTFLLDEFEMYQKLAETKGEIIGVLNAGYRRGQMVLRTDKVQDGAPILKGFSTFGFKAISSIEELPKPLQSRTIRFAMSKATRKIARLIDKDGARKLRGMLLQWRFDHYSDPSPEGNPINLEDGRLIELYTPLVMVAPQHETAILNYAKGQYQQSVEEERDTIEAQVFMAVCEILRDNHEADVTQEMVRNRVNALRSERDQLKAATVGRILKRLGIQSKRGEKQLKTLVLNKDQMVRRVQRYYVGDELKEMLDVLIVSFVSIVSIKGGSGGSEGQRVLTPVLEGKEARFKPLIYNTNTNNDTIDTINTIDTKKIDTIDTLFKPESVLSVTPLKPLACYAGHCDVCGKGNLNMVDYPKPLIRFRAELFSGEKKFLCGDCGEAAMKRLKETAA